MSPLVASALYDELAAIGAAAADGESFDATAIDAIAEAGLLHVSVPKEVGGAERRCSSAIDVWSRSPEQTSSGGSPSRWTRRSPTSGPTCPEEGIADLFADGPRMAGQFAPNMPRWPRGTTGSSTGPTSSARASRSPRWPAAGSSPRRRVAAIPPTCSAACRSRRSTSGNWHDAGAAGHLVDRLPHHRRPRPRPSHLRLLRPTVHRGRAGPLRRAAAHRGGPRRLGARCHPPGARRAAGRGRADAHGGGVVDRHERPQVSFARLESRYRAGRAWVREVCEQAEAEVEATGELLSAATGDLVRQACVHVNQDGAAIARARTSWPAPRPCATASSAARDLHAGAQHFFASDAASLDWARGLLAREG
ncbi:MAG: hypothetical protein R2711_17065 [Acidimicrobiales bacterium]